MHQNYIRTATPCAKRFKGVAWKNGMQIVILQSTGEPITHWYYCSKCGKFINTNLTKGTGTIRAHVDVHKKMNTYTFQIMELKELLAMATKFGSENGARNPKDFELPPSENWNTDFWNNLLRPSGERLPCIRGFRIKLKRSLCLFSFSSFQSV